MTNFTQEVIQIIQNIPAGKVMTYGQIAIQAGNPWGARQVVRILNSSSGTYHLPWHRVINAKGGISLTGVGGWEQCQLLLDEGVMVENGFVDLDKYLYRPEFNHL
jgi:methylated-DNA-protein-cysteine methyltransferase-like protein